MESAADDFDIMMTPDSKKMPPPAKRDWLKTAGWAINDTVYEEVLRLGCEYRRSMTVELEHADS